MVSTPQQQLQGGTTDTDTALVNVVCLCKNAKTKWDITKANREAIEHVWAVQIQDTTRTKILPSLACSLRQVFKERSHYICPHRYYVPRALPFNAENRTEHIIDSVRFWVQW